MGLSEILSVKYIEDPTGQQPVRFGRLMSVVIETAKEPHRETTRTLDLRRISTCGAFLGIP